MSPSSVLRSAARESVQADLLADSLQAGRVEAGEPEIELSAPPPGESQNYWARPDALLLSTRASVLIVDSEVPALDDEEC